MDFSLSDVVRSAVPAAVLAADSVKDIRTRMIFPVLTSAAAVAGGIWSVMDSGVREVLIGIVPGILVMGYSLLSGGKVGAGDGIAVCMTGAWLGFAVSLTSLFSGLFLAVFSETVIHIISSAGGYDKGGGFMAGRKGRDVFRKKNAEGKDRAGSFESRSVPFLPYLLAGFIISILCMTEWV